MVLKFKDLDGNWNFREGDIRYRFNPFCDVLVEFLETQGYYGVNATEGITAIGKGKSEIVSDYEKFLKKCNTENIVVPSFFEMIRDYIIEHFDRAGDASMQIDLSNLVSQNVNDLFGMYFVEIYRPDKLETDYVLLNCGYAYLLSDTGKTIEKLG